MAKYQYKVKGVDYEVEIQDIEGNIANVTVNGIPFEVEMKQPVKAGKQKFRIANEATDDKGGVSSADSAKTTPTGSSASSANAEAAASNIQCAILHSQACIRTLVAVNTGCSITDLQRTAILDCDIIPAGNANTGM